MQLSLPTEGCGDYKSASQRARVATEQWGLENLFCPNCASNHLSRKPHNTPAVDFACPSCEAAFQLKSQGRPFSFRLADAAYHVMRQAIAGNRTPNLFVLHYDQKRWDVRNVILVPKFAFSMAALECRKPLGGSARRAGWVGCNILLGRIPADAKIPIVAEGRSTATSEVRKQYARMRPLEALTVENRGWTLDVLNAVRGLGKTDFALADAYALESSLGQLHPRNRHIRDKIRQQLQVLRDLGIIAFLGRGRYQVVREMHVN